MGKQRDKGVDFDMKLQIGIMIGAEWSLTDIGQHFGVTSQAINMRKLRDKDKLIERVAVWTRTAISKYIEDRIKAAEEDLQERKKRLHKKGYRLIEKVVDAGLEAEPEDVDMRHIIAAEKGIERTEGKPMDRKTIMAQSVSYHVDVDGDDLMAVLNETARLNELRRLALPAPADEQSD